MANTLGLWNYLQNFDELSISVKNGRLVSIRVYDSKKLLALIRKYGLLGTFGNVLEKCNGEGYKIRRCKDYKNFCDVEGETSHMREALIAYHHTKDEYPPKGMPVMEKAHYLEKVAAKARGADYCAEDYSMKKGDYIADYKFKDGRTGEHKSAEHGRIF